MIQTSSQWHNLREVKKGDIGEAIIQKFLEEKGFMCYKPQSEGPHTIDMPAIKNGELFYFEVKTKELRNQYPDTGFPNRQFKTYREFTVKEGKKLFIFFVDYIKQEVYGNYLHRLERLRKVTLKNGREILYPCIHYDKSKHEDIRFYPYSAMIPEILKLTDEQCEMIREVSKH